MSSGGAEAFSAAFRYLGIDSHPSPEGDERTYELAGKCTSGDECLPARVVLGNFLRVIEQPDFDPSKVAFFMPTAGGPCRFGQYSPFTEQVMEEMGHSEVMIVSPTSADGYASLGENAGDALKLGWWGLVASDAFRKMLHIYRPYETVPGAADEAHAKSLKRFCDVLADNSEPLDRKLDSLAGAMEQARDFFRAVPADWERDVMLVGVVGEIFCRLSTFSNEDLIRRLEPFGAQAWLSDITEWVHYTDSDNVRNLKRLGKTFSMDMLKALMKSRVQHSYEKKLLAPLQEEFVGVEEPHDVKEVLDLAEPYLPVSGSHGEMVLSVGKAIYMYEKGADGVIDISPFTCMNGIISEAVYPRVSADHEGIPIRNFYFDGTQTDLENDLGIFMELVRNYHRKKTRKRIRRAVTA
jgi:predicted nucleotide-binding protein (sugar kinase/HSP70/actin superfamily)